MKQLLTLLLSLVLFGCTKKDGQVAASDTIATDTAKSIQTDRSDSTLAELKKEVTRFSDPDSYTRLDSYLVDANPDTAVFQTINKDCAILVYPTEEQFEFMEKEYGEDFYTIADDNAFYQVQAMEVLDSLGVMTIIVGQKRYLKLIDRRREWTLDIRQSGAPGWNLILFSLGKRPKVVAAINIDSALIMEYFYDEVN